MVFLSLQALTLTSLKTLRESTLNVFLSLFFYLFFLFYFKLVCVRGFTWWLRRKRLQFEL